MAMLDSAVSALPRPYSELEIDEAQLAAVGSLPGTEAARSMFNMAALDAGVPLRDVQIAARPAHDHDLRPAPPELRSPRCVRRRRVHRRRVT